MRFLNPDLWRGEVVLYFIVIILIIVISMFIKAKKNKKRDDIDLEMDAFIEEKNARKRNVEKEEND